MMVLLGSARSMAMQSAKMRVPLIKFRYGQGRETASQPTHSSPTIPQQPARPRAAQTVDETQLPVRFHRQLISEEEIDYINRGGPA